MHDYSNRSNSGSSALMNSGAKVKVYNGSSMLADMSVPSGAGIYWNVFTIRNGRISFTNTIGKASPGASTQSSLIATNRYLINVVDKRIVFILRSY